MEEKKVSKITKIGVWIFLIGILSLLLSIVGIVVCFFAEIKLSIDIKIISIVSSFMVILLGLAIIFDEEERGKTAGRGRRG